MKTNKKQLLSILLFWISTTLSIHAQDCVADAGQDGYLTCEQQCVFLDGSNSSTGADIVHEWTTVDGCITGDGTTLYTEVCCAGNYCLTVTNTTTGCTAESCVIVIEDVYIPIVDAGPDQLLDCNNFSITLDGTGSDTGPEMTYAWTSDGGQAITDANTLTPTITEAGTYCLTVINSYNGCYSQDCVSVVEDISIPTADIQIQCGNTNGVTLDGSGSDIGPGMIYEWTDQGGAFVGTGISVTVTATGTYILTVTNSSNNCASAAEITVYSTDFNSDLAQLVSSTAATCQNNNDNPSDFSCEKVCANSTATYSVYVPNGEATDIVWTVQGAEDYSIQGNELIVEWGGPGAGQISYTATNSSSSSGIEIYCGDYTKNPSGTLFMHSTEAPEGPEYTYVWTASNGGNIAGGETTLSPSVTDAGTYTLTVTNIVTGETASCISTVYETNSCYIVGGASVSPSSENCNCNGSINISPDGGTGSFTYEWSNGSTTQDQTGLCAGFYQVTITDSGGCIGIQNFYLSCNEAPSTCPLGETVCIDIIEEPQAIVATTPAADANGVINICQGQSIYFDNQSTDAEYYSWNLGQGEELTSADVNQVYNEAGTFLVTLIARNECLCSDTLQLTIEVQESINPDVGCAGTICAGESVTYTSEADCGIFNWTILNGTVTGGGGTSDNFVTVDWGNGPVGTVELLVDDCTGDYCIQPAIYQIPIIADNTIIEGPVEVCKGESATYTVPDYGGTDFFWSVSNYGEITSGQGTNFITVSWTDLTTSSWQWVKVEYGSCFLECSGEEQLDVDILPEFLILGEIEACQNSTSMLRAQRIGSSQSALCDWTITSPSGTTFFTATAVDEIDVDWTGEIGTYTIYATASVPTDYCKDEYTAFIDIILAPQPPSSIEGPDLLCPGQFYTYSATSTETDVRYIWSVEDGFNTYSKEGQEINIEWGNTPPYILNLSHISTEGLPCQSTSISREFFPYEDLNLTGTNSLCIEETGNYIATYYDDISYEWTITPSDAGSILNGDGSSEINVLWHSSGAHTVAVQMCNLSATVSVNIPVNPMPTVSYPDALCFGQTGTVECNEVFVNYKWKSQSGNILSTNQTTQLAPGNYQLEVTDADGCVGDTLFNIMAYPEPVINISSPLELGLCPDTITSLHALQTDEGYNYQWYFNGAPMGANEPVLYTNMTGNYYVEVVDQNGCTNTSNTIPILLCEDVGGTCFGNICGIIIPGGTGVPSSGGPTITCNPDGIIDFDYEVTDECKTLNFFNASTNMLPGTFSWNFGAGNTSTDENSTHSFSGGAGYYPVTIYGGIPNVGDPSIICNYDYTENVPVWAAANFDVTLGCVTEETFFTDISTFLPETSIQSWTWDFGDPTSGTANTSTDKNPSHIYNAIGDYIVHLTIVEEGGCTSEITKTITIISPPAISFVPPIDNNCQGNALNFIVQTTNTNIASYEWDFGDPTSGDANTGTVENTFHVYESAGQYTVTLTATNIQGCTTTYTDDVFVEQNNLSGNISFSNPPPMCEGESTNAFAPDGGVAWEWSDGSANNTISNITEAGTYTVTVTDEEGCTFVSSQAVVDILPLPSGSIRLVEFNEFGQPEDYNYTGFAACEGTDVFLEIIGDDGYTYTWSEGTSGEELFFTEDRDNLLTAGDYDFSVTITDSSTGCTSIEGPFEVTIYPLPAAVSLQSSPSGVLCNNDFITISINDPDIQNQYIWSNGAIGTTIVTMEGGDYSVTATNADGCESASDTITVYEGPQINRIPSGCHTHCNPDTICLPDLTGIASFQWYYEDLPIPAPEGTVEELIIEESGDYYVILTDEFGCTASSGILSMDLFDAYGTIEGNVYFDVNENGIIDAADTLMSNVEIILTENGSAIDTVNAGQNGIYAFANINSTDYTLVLDSLSLPPNHYAYYTEVDASLFGCDDETTVDWLVFENCIQPLASVTLSACENSTATFYGNEYAPNTTSQLTVAGLGNCDTIYTISVEGIEVNYETLNVAACEGTAYDYYGTFIMAGASEEILLTNVNGCDSTVHVIVAANEEITVNDTLSACANSFALYNGEELAVGSTTEFPFTSVNGCDSIVSIFVEELLGTSSFIEIDTCEGESIIYNGVEVLAGQQQVFTLTNVAGCDSIVTLSVGEILSPLSVEELFVCENEEAIYDNQVLAIGTDTTFIFTSSNGCDSIVDLSVTMYPPLIFSLAHDGEVCWNAFDGKVQVINQFGGTGPYEYSIDGENFQAIDSFSNLSAGMYEVQIRDANSCIYTEAIEIPEIEKIEILLEDQTIACEADSIVLIPEIISGNSLALDYLWEDGTSAFTHPVYTPGNYQLTTSNECETIQQNINVALANDDRSEFIYVPNAFTPNEDGFNDLFLAEPASNVLINSYIIYVFDRWGTLLFMTSDYTEGWDGRQNFKTLDEGVYVWYLETNITACGRTFDLMKKGDIAILR